MKAFISLTALLLLTACSSSVSFHSNDGAQRPVRHAVDIKDRCPDCGEPGYPRWVGQ